MVSLKKIQYKYTTYKKMALITGGNRGIGKQTALVISKSVYLVFVTTTQKKHMKKFNFYLNEKHVKNIIVSILDLRYKKKINEFAGYIKKKIGILLIIVNNAGKSIDRTILKLNCNDWLAVVNINLNAVFYITKLFLPKMIFLNWGRVISISSIVACTGNIGQTNYSSAKAGLVGFSKSLAKEVASKGITVNVISPGFIATNMTKNININDMKNLIPIKKFGKTKNIANIIKMLISNKMSYITGETININGGLYMK